MRLRKQAINLDTFQENTFPSGRIQEKTVVAGEEADKIIQDYQKREEHLKQMIAKKTFREEQYFRILKKFIDSECDFEYMVMTSLDDIKDAWRVFLENLDDPAKNMNISLSISPKDIASIDPRFSFVRIHLCKYCGQKIYKGCCSNYSRSKGRKTKYSMVNLVLKKKMLTV